MVPYYQNENLEHTKKFISSKLTVMALNYPDNIIILILYILVRLYYQYFCYEKASSANTQ